MKQPHTLVVGGTRGIGLAVVRTFAGEGHCVSVIGRRDPPFHNARLQRVRHWMVNLVHETKLKSVLKSIVRTNGKLNGVVFCQRFRNSGDAWQGDLTTSLSSTREVIERLRDDFVARGDKAIVIIASIAATWVAEEQGPGYHVSKAGLVQLARYYAQTLGPRGIRVNCVSPGTTVKDENTVFYQRNRPIRQLYSRITPLRRMGTSDDVANAVSFLCSARAAFITGQNIIVDGGVSLQWPESLARRLKGGR